MLYPSTPSCFFNIFAFFWGALFVTLFSFSSLLLSRGDASVLHRRLHASSFAPILSGHLAADLVIVTTAYDTGLRTFNSGRIIFSEEFGTLFNILSRLQRILIDAWFPFLFALILQFNTFEWLSISTRIGAQTLIVSVSSYNTTINSRYTRTPNEINELALGGFSKPDPLHLSKAAFLILTEEHFHEQLCEATLWPIVLLIIYKLSLLTLSYISVLLWKTSESASLCQVCGVRMCITSEHDKLNLKQSISSSISSSLVSLKRQNHFQDYICSFCDLRKFCIRSTRRRFGLCFCAKPDSLLLWIVLVMSCCAMIWRIRVSPTIDVIRFTSRFIESTYYDMLFTGAIAHFPSFVLGLIAARLTARRDFGQATSLFSRFIWFIASIGLILGIAYDASAWLYFINSDLRSLALAFYHPLFSTCYAIFLSLSHRSTTFISISIYFIRILSFPCRLFSKHIYSTKFEETSTNRLKNSSLIDVHNACRHVNRTVFFAWCFILPFTVFLSLNAVSTSITVETAISSILIITVQATSFSLLISLAIRLLIHHVFYRIEISEVLRFMKQALRMPCLRVIWGGRKISVDTDNSNIHNAISITSRPNVASLRLRKRRVTMDTDAWIMGEEVREKVERTAQTGLTTDEIDVEMEKEENEENEIVIDPLLEQNDNNSREGKEKENEEVDKNDNFGKEEKEEEEEEEEEEEYRDSGPILFGGLDESEAIRAQQVADLIASRVQNESFEASFLSPTSELLFYPADAALIASGVIVIGTTSVYNQVLGTASFVVNRFKRLGAFFRKRVKSRATRQGGFQWTIQSAISDDLDEENQEGIENKDNVNDEDFDGPDVLSPSERIQSQRQAASIKVANRMQRSALALALQWREGCSPESAPTDATFLRVLQLVQDQILQSIEKRQDENMND